MSHVPSRPAPGNGGSPPQNLHAGKAPRPRHQGLTGCRCARLSLCPVSCALCHRRISQSPSHARRNQISHCVQQTCLDGDEDYRRGAGAVSLPGGTRRR